jgi:hypothetical protein
VLTVNEAMRHEAKGALAACLCAGVKCASFILSQVGEAAGIPEAYRQSGALLLK